MARRCPWLAVVACLLLAAGCGSNDPFHYVRVSGRLTYQDGSLIPADGIALRFYPEQGSLDTKTHPRPGMSIVERATGEFHDVTSHRLNDGLVPGKHRVVILAGDFTPLPASLLPPEYADLATTPLMIDTAQQPLVIRVRKPSSVH
jgi:hypothetical protein